MFFISVLYHRGFAHVSVILGPKMKKIIAMTGIWFTGLDPVSWISQYKSYKFFLDKMKLKDIKFYNNLMRDITIGVSKMKSNIP